jgi:hypothetical protein
MGCRNDGAAEELRRAQTAAEAKKQSDGQPIEAINRLVAALERFEQHLPEPIDSFIMSARAKKS